MGFQPGDFPHQIGIVTPAIVTDRYGSETKDWEAAVTVIADARMRQRSSVETADGREARTSTWFVMTPPAKPIEALDRITFDGRTFEVHGDIVEAFDLGAGVTHHYEAELKIVEG